MEDSINFDVEIKKAKYKHFRGGMYETIDVAYIAHDKPLVLYKSLETGKLWVREINDFFGNVKREDYEGPRFIEVKDV